MAYKSDTPHDPHIHFCEEAFGRLADEDLQHVDRWLIEWSLRLLGHPDRHLAELFDQHEDVFRIVSKDLRKKAP